MITVNSLSGGKTSSYLAAHYPSEVEVFALVCIDDMNAGGRRIDAKMRQKVNDKLQKYCSHECDFRSTAEDPIILKTMFDLEQHLGREITWVRGMGWQEISNFKHLIPNKQHRYCTTLLKIDPIFRFLYMYHTLPVKMRIGFRADEAHRAETFKETYLFSHQCDIGKGKEQPIWDNYNRDFFTGHTPKHMHRWTEIPFRVGDFPLIDDGVTQLDVQKYWQDKSIVFPEDSNCLFCFWKHPQQLRKNFDYNPPVMWAAAVMEEMIGGTFHSDFSMQEISKIGIQTDLFQMKGGCSGGYCAS